MQKDVSTTDSGMVSELAPERTVPLLLLFHTAFGVHFPERVLFASSFAVLPHYLL